MNPTCTVHHWVTAHDGPGFYYVDDEYDDEGSCGAFATLDEACDHARVADYEPIACSCVEAARLRLAVERSEQ